MSPEPDPELKAKIQKVLDQLAKQCDWYWWDPRKTDLTYFCVLDRGHTGDHSNPDGDKEWGRLDPQYWFSPPTCEEFESKGGAMA